MRSLMGVVLVVLFLFRPGDGQAESATQKRVASKRGLVVITFNGLSEAHKDPHYDRVYSLGSMAKASGHVSNLPQNGSVWIGLRQVGSSVWLTHRAQLTGDPARADWRATIAMPVLAYQGYSLEMIAMAANGPSMPAVVEQSRLHRHCADASEPVTLNPDATWRTRVRMQAGSRTRLHLTRIGDRSTGRSVIVPVALHEPIYATARNLPEGAVLQAVVQPVEDCNCWAMPGRTRLYRGSWQGTAYFGREGMDRFKRFWVYVVATTRPMPTGQKIGREEWRTWRLLAVSPPVSAIRTVDPGELRVRIDRIDGDPVASEGVWLAANGSRVEGAIEFYGATGDEQDTADGQAPDVLLLSAPEGRDAWWVSGVGFARSRGSQWTVVSAKFTNGDGRRKLLAVVLAPSTKGQTGRTWHKGEVFRDWSRVLAISDEVRVRVQSPSGSLAPASSPTDGTGAVR